jgi:hypothetical protein
MTDHKSVAEPHVLESKFCKIISYTLICLRNDANPSTQLIGLQSFMCRIYTSSMELQYIYWWSPANRMHQRVDQASTTLSLSFWYCKFLGIFQLFGEMSTCHAMNMKL